MKAGFYTPDPVNRPNAKYLKIQILTVEQLFTGKKPHIPLVDPTAFRKAAREDTSHDRQTGLF